MLNMSSASIYKDKLRDNNIGEYIERMASTAFFETAFDITNFNSILSSSKSMKTIYITRANQFQIPLATSLDSIINFLRNATAIHPITVTITPDDTSQAAILLAAAYRNAGSTIYDGEDDAAWNYVADHVAANTKFEVKMNLAEFGKLYNIL